MLTMLIIIGSHVAGGRRFCSVAFFMPPIFVFNLYSDYIRRKSARQESSTVVWRTKVVSSHGHFRLVVTVSFCRLDTVWDVQGKNVHIS